MAGKWFFCLILLISLFPIEARAGQGEGEMVANVFNPKTMPESRAKVWCAQNPEARACEELEEKWKRKDEEDLFFGFVDPKKQRIHTIMKAEIYE